MKPMSRSLPRRRRQRGVTLIELIIAITILGVLAAVGSEMYAGYVQDSRERVMMGELQRIGVLIERFRTDNGRLPDNLAEMGVSIPPDPYGNGYQYLRIEGQPPSIKAQVRKDKNLVPINSDYDLYSMGPDAQSKPPLTAKPSRDDIVRAANGGFIGLATDY